VKGTSRNLKSTKKKHLRLVGGKVVKGADQKNEENRSLQRIKGKKFALEGNRDRGSIPFHEGKKGVR